MSNSIAAAKRRRAGNMNTDNNVVPPGSNTCSPNTNTNTSMFQQQSSRMSIPNYLSLMEKKILELEQKMPNNDQVNIQIEVDGEDGKKVISMTEYMEDMDKKFNLLVEEMSNMKETIMDLQRFTMNVNSKLVSNIFPNEDFTLKNNIENVVEE
jgi:hypothetical protein|tara:strand:- start:1708 stop:2166 length:459 start_codon:yes stop_codon:yes gene_type:complete